MNRTPLILIIDDEEDLRDMMVFQFRAKGYDTVTARDGIDGLEKLATVNPQLIILDLNMPRMGGIEFYQRICTAEGRPSHPVLILTARANTEQLFKDLDIDGFVAKPFEIDALVVKAEEIIKKRDRKVVAGEQGKISLKVKTVYVVDNDPVSLEKISLGLLRAGYRVAIASSGAEGIEALTAEPPTLGLIKLGLSDISGDLVAQRAHRSTKSTGVKFLLYEPRDARHLRPIKETIGDKSGIIDLIEYETITDIINAVDSAIKKGMVSEDVEKP